MLTRVCDFPKCPNEARFQARGTNLGGQQDVCQKHINWIVVLQFAGPEFTSASIEFDVLPLEGVQT